MTPKPDSGGKKKKRHEMFPDANEREKKEAKVEMIRPVSINMKSK
jgi:hypothetical protein